MHKICTQLPPVEPATPEATNNVSRIDWPALVAGIASGDDAATLRFWRMLQRGIKYYLLKQLPLADAEDALSETFQAVIVAVRRGCLIQPAALLGFARTVAQRLVAANIGHAMIARQREGDPDAAYAAPDSRHNPEKEAILNERAAMVREVIGALQPRDREIIQRSFIEEQPKEQIMAAMRLSETQLRLIKSRAKGKLAAIERRIEQRRVGAARLAA